MFELKPFGSRIKQLQATPRSPNPREPQQRRMMVIALTMLLIALGFVLYHDRDFWFPGTQEAADQTQPQPMASAISPTPTQAAAPKPIPPLHKKSHGTKSQPKTSASSDLATADPSAPPMTATATRTVLPPLEVEVVAGDVHRTLHPGTNSIHVDLQPDAPTPEVSDAPTDTTGTAASLTTNAAERMQISADTAEAVTRPIKPGYPLLARQMKVQGSVILQALVGRDGLIQDLRVLSGPPILANAAQEAVKQWHFKPHYLGAEPVETQARITVNFTISTN
jgi:TonB family protein